MEVKAYYPHLDQLKGLAILLMVMGHGLAWSYPDYSFLFQKMESMTPEIFNASIIWKVIYSFHMPLLFFVSGFLFYKSGISWTFSSVKRLLSKRTKRLLIPYMITGWAVLFLKGYFGYWFFIVLFVLNIIVLCELFILEKCKSSIVGEVIAHASLFAMLLLASKLYNVYLPKSLSNLSNISSYYFVFILGYMINKYKRLDKLVRRDIVSLICLLCYIVLMIIVMYHGYLSNLSVLIPISAILFLYHMSFNSKSVILRMISSYSMEIYVFHLFFLSPIQEVGIYIINISNFPISITIQLTYSLIISTIAIFFSIISAKVIKSNHLLSQLIFGK